MNASIPFFSESYLVLSVLSISLISSHSHSGPRRRGCFLNSGPSRLSVLYLDLNGARRRYALPLP
jgi:hypothetical protein